MQSIFERLAAMVKRAEKYALNVKDKDAVVAIAFGVRLTFYVEPASVTNSGKAAAASATSNAYPSTPVATQTQALPGHP